MELSHLENARNLVQRKWLTQQCGTTCEMNGRPCLEWIDIFGKELRRRVDQEMDRSSTASERHTQRPSWDSVFMGFAISLAQRSTCARAKVGCIVVSSDNHRVLAVGYNGSYRGGPNRCDSNVPGNCGCLHAEDNCMIKLDYNNPGEKRMYVTSMPCATCAKRIVNAQIDEVVWLAPYRLTEGMDILKKAGVRTRQPR